MAARNLQTNAMARFVILLFLIFYFHSNCMTVMFCASSVPPSRDCSEKGAVADVVVGGAIGLAGNPVGYGYAATILGLSLFGGSSRPGSSGKNYEPPAIGTANFAAVSPDMNIALIGRYPNIVQLVDTKTHAILANIEDDDLRSLVNAQFLKSTPRIVIGTARGGTYFLELNGRFSKIDGGTNFQISELRDIILTMKYKNHFISPSSYTLYAHKLSDGSLLWEKNDVTSYSFTDGDSEINFNEGVRLVRLDSRTGKEKIPENLTVTPGYSKQTITYKPNEVTMVTRNGSLLSFSGNFLSRQFFSYSRHLVLLSQGSLSHTLLLQVIDEDGQELLRTSL